MAKKAGVPKSRTNKKIHAHPCGCFYCCGNPDEEYRKRKLRIPKHKGKDWSED